MEQSYSTLCRGKKQKMSIHYEKIEGNKLLRREGEHGDVLDIFTTHRLHLPQGDFFEQTYLPQYQKQPPEEWPFLRVYKTAGEDFVGNLFIPHSELNKSLENRILRHARVCNLPENQKIIIQNGRDALRVTNHATKNTLPALENVARAYVQERHQYHIDGDALIPISFLAMIVILSRSLRFALGALIASPVYGYYAFVKKNKKQFMLRKKKQKEIMSGMFSEERLIDLYSFLEYSTDHSTDEIKKTHAPEALKELTTKLPFQQEILRATYTTKSYEALCRLFRRALAGQEMPAQITTLQKKEQQPLELIIEKKPLCILDTTHYAGQVIDDYTLIEPIGSGGIGIWYKATDKEGKTVAIKFPKEGQEQAFARMASLLPALKHAESDALVKTLDGNDSYVVTEFLDCVSLRDVMKQRMPLQTATYFIARIAEALAHAHTSVGITHNDVKPENVLITSDGNVKLGDFDLAETTTKDSLEETLKTLAMTGTPAYVAPERSGKIQAQTGPHSDVYSLGVLFYELITGTTTIDRTPLTTYTPEVTPVIEQLITGMTAAQPKQRMPLQEVQKHLETLQQQPLLPKIILREQKKEETIPTCANTATNIDRQQSSTPEEVQTPARPPLDVVLAQKQTKSQERRKVFE